MPATPSAMPPAFPTAEWPRLCARMMPSLLIIGAQKCGTTSLFEYLASHPSVRPPRAKELQHFTKRWERGPRAYARKFPFRWEGGEGTITFESSPAYMFFPPAPVRAHAMLPGARLVALLRDPVERAWSHWRHERRAGNEPLEFADAIDAEQQRLAGQYEAWLADNRHDLTPYWTYSYTARGLYAQQLDRWVEAYGRDALLVLRAEDMFEHPGDVFDRVLSFLGLEAWRPDSFAVHNAGGSREDIPTGVRDALQARFEGPNAELRERYGDDLRWRE